MVDPSAHVLADQWRGHYGHREHLYGVLLAELADDLEAGGPTAEILQGRLDSPRSDAVHLRLLAGLFRIVLRGDAQELTRFYPSLGGEADPEDAWPLVRRVLTDHVGELTSALDLAPQTNEVGRSANLLVGLFESVRRHGRSRVRLLEPGASAGLNLNVDRYRFLGDGWAWGPDDSPVVLDTLTAGVRPEALTVVDRKGCDLSPVDAATDQGAAYLTSFVWPFQLDRHARLAGALGVVRAHPVVVDRAPASTWLAEQLAAPVADDVLTVVWTSITQQYWPAAESAAVAVAIDEARERMAISHVALEGVPPAQMPGGFDIARHGPQTTVDGDPIARSSHHGPPLLMHSPDPSSPR